MKSFAEMSEAERRYEVAQIISEARECGHDLKQVMVALVWKFASSGVEPPVSLVDWLEQKTIH
ncbi:hypothetical protein [Asticcacaulis tiandongensis]|uniref:hypothetical protein n=1 Tax=Asticcacaulis tiandongensis TaxID=2565365 RepID=UPI0011272256|nr:hypothetical protein [Asticcacaulis tiandongensis]